MTNKEKLEIIDKKLEMLYEELSDLENFTSDAQKNITQAIYNLESTKLLLEEIECKPQNVIGFNMESQERIDGEEREDNICPIL